MNYSARNLITGSVYPEISSRAGARGLRVVVGVVPALILASTATPALSQVMFPLVPNTGDHGIGAHPEHGQTTHPCLHTWCCTFKDCRPLAQGATRQTPEGFDIPLPDGRRAVVAYTDKRIRQAKPECQSDEFGQQDWACYNEVDGQWQVRCYYPRPVLF